MRLKQISKNEKPKMIGTLNRSCLRGKCRGKKKSREKQEEKKRTGRQKQRKIEYGGQRESNRTRRYIDL